MCYREIFPLFFPSSVFLIAIGRYNTRENIRESKTSSNLVFTRVCGCEYAMSRTMSPMMVSQYQLQLPDKEVLRKKLLELANIPQIEDKE